MPRVDTLLWDVGGVVLSNAWDHAARARAVERFGLEPTEFERRHAALVGPLETGRLGWEEYLARCVFYAPRAFSRADFQQFVWDQSSVHRPVWEFLRTLRVGGWYVLAALNNESRELNEHRVRSFRLTELFHVFFSSCDTGLRKPEPDAFRHALALLHRSPEECLFLDDRPENVEAAGRLGLGTFLVRAPDRLPEELMAAGLSPE